MPSNSSKTINSYECPQIGEEILEMECYETCMAAAQQFPKSEAVPKITQNKNWRNICRRCPHNKLFN